MTKNLVRSGALSDHGDLAVGRQADAGHLATDLDRALDAVCVGVDHRDGLAGRVGHEGARAVAVDGDVERSLADLERARCGLVPRSTTASPRLPAVT